MITQELMQIILAQYEQSWNGIHGPAHWARVLENGRRLSQNTGARLEVVEFFAVFHDARRRNEGFDPGHGKRGAKLARQLRGKYFDLSDEDFALLEKACNLHTAGQTDADVSIQTCWDSDRLDLARARIMPKPAKLCTPFARTPEIIAWANRRSQALMVPDLVAEEWKINLIF